MTLLINKAQVGIAVVRARIGLFRVPEFRPERHERFPLGEKRVQGLMGIGVDQVMALLFSPKSGIVNR